MSAAAPPHGRSRRGRSSPADCAGSACYDGLTDYPHGTVDHGIRQYVVGAIHTNTIEGFWSIFKRGIVGSFHKVSAKYMPLYVAEFEFRYNNRGNADIFGTAIAGC